MSSDLIGGLLLICILIPASICLWLAVIQIVFMGYRDFITWRKRR